MRRIPVAGTIRFTRQHGHEARTDRGLQVSDAYKKVGLAPGYHRVNMCSRAVEQSSWLMVDPYETVNCDENGQPQYVPTAKVLQHFDHEINTVLGGIEGADGQMKKARIALLAGGSIYADNRGVTLISDPQAPTWSCPWVGLIRQIHAAQANENYASPASGRPRIWIPFLVRTAPSLLSALGPISTRPLPRCGSTRRIFGLSAR